MCDYSLEAYRSRPARIGEKYETHRFESFSIGFVAPGDRTTAVCMACDTKLKLEGIPQGIQRAYGVSPTEDVVFIQLENSRHHDGVRFANGMKVTLQELGPGVTGYITETMSLPLRALEPAEAV